MASGEVGKAGVSISHWRDMEELLEGIPLGSINTSMTINATAPFLLALYLVVAEKHGESWDQLRGTTQNNLMKEFVARGTSIFHPEVSFRLSTELIKFAVTQVPNWNPINVLGYHYMESGCGPAEEIGYAFGNALVPSMRCARKLRLKTSLRPSSAFRFFINRRMAAPTGNLPKSARTSSCGRRYANRSTASTVCCSAPDARCARLALTEQQPEVNILRIAYEALPVVLSADARVNALG